MLLGLIGLVLGLFLGIVLIVEGLHRRRQAAWIGGFVIFALGVLLFCLTVAFDRRQQLPRPAVKVYLTNAEPIPGLTLPQGVHTGMSEGISPDEKSRDLLSLFKWTVPASFDNFLSAHFTRVPWEQASPLFEKGYSPVHDRFLQPDDELKAMVLYIRTSRPNPNSPETVTAVAYDPNSHQAWVVSVKGRGLYHFATPPPPTRPASAPSDP